MLQESLSRVKKMILENKDLVSSLSHTLLRKETLSAKEFNDIVDAHKSTKEEPKLSFNY